PELALAQELNQRMQARFRQWHETTIPQNPPVIFDQRQLPWFVALNKGMHDTLDDAGVRERLRENVRLLQGLADAIDAQVAGGGADTDALPSGQPLPALFMAPA
ncbi:MAG TPA: halogenase, partial [Rhodanobacter sp.]|nr:halogenase [Rhodanobacter sp.]